MKAKEYLSRPHYMEIRVKQMQAEIAEYKRLASSIPGCSFDRILVDGTRQNDAPFVKWIYKAIDREKQMNELINKLPFVKGETISVIDEIENSDYKMVLLYKYIDWLSWSEIASKMYYSTATIRRWHDKAITLIKVSIKNEQV